jgi:hypothetical protein
MRPRGRFFKPRWRIVKPIDELVGGNARDAFLFRQSVDQVAGAAADP